MVRDFQNASQIRFTAPSCDRSHIFRLGNCCVIVCVGRTQIHRHIIHNICVCCDYTLGKFVSCDIVHDIETTYLGFLVYVFLQHMLYSTVCRAIESFKCVALCVKMNLQIRPVKDMYFSILFSICVISTTHTWPLIASTVFNAGSSCTVFSDN